MGEIIVVNGKTIGRTFKGLVYAGVIGGIMTAIGFGGYLGYQYVVKPAAGWADRRYKASSVAEDIGSYINNRKYAEAKKLLEQNSDLFGKEEVAKFDNLIWGGVYNNTKSGVGEAINKGDYFKANEILNKSKVYLQDKDIKDLEQAIREAPKKRASADVENAIGAGKYAEALKALENTKENLTQEKYSELEAKVKDLHPDSMFEKAKKAEFKDRFDLLKKVYLGYKELEQEKPEVKEFYLNSYISKIADDLDNNKSLNAKKDIDAFFKDEFLFGKPGPEGNPAVFNVGIAVDDKVYEELFKAEAKFLEHNFSEERFTGTTKNSINLAVNEAIEDADKTMNKVLALASSLKPDNLKVKEKMPLLLEAYAKGGDALIKNPNIAMPVKKNLIKSLRTLEKQHDYKIQAMDVDKLILDFFDK